MAGRPSMQVSLVALLATISLLQVGRVSGLQEALINGGQQQQQEVGDHKLSGKFQEATVPNSDAASEDRAFEAWKMSPLYLESFEEGMKSVPKGQVEWIRKVFPEDQKFILQIVDDAIKRRNEFAPSVSLMFRWSGKFLNHFIKRRSQEKQISPRVEPKSAFFRMFANIIQQVLDRGAQIKREKGYKKAKLDVVELRQRLVNLMKYLGRIINASPLAAYLKWDQAVLYKDEPHNPLWMGDFIEEASDITAQFRVMGYESCTFVAKRLINLLRMFSRGFVPRSETEI